MVYMQKTNKVAQALFGYDVIKHKTSWRLNTIITLNFKHFFFFALSLSLCLSTGQTFKREHISEGRLSKTEVCTEYFPLIFFFLLSLSFLSLPMTNVYFSSLRERLGGSGPDLGAHNSSGPASLMKFKLTAA